MLVGWMLWMGCGAGTQPAVPPIGLSLDGEVRWQMDDHTRGVMAETRKTLAAAHVGAAADATALGAALQEQLDRLLRGCTMEGPAHDELHTFLIAYMPAVEALQKTTDVAEARAQIVALRGMVAEYERFFE